MGKEMGVFLVKLLAFAGLLFAVHFYILLQLFSGTLYFPLWGIYLFNAALVLAVYVVLRWYAAQESKNVFKIFLMLTIAKMALVIIFLLPLFLKKSDHTLVEVFNFFIPYFLLLLFETIAINKFLQKT
ncbi:hypothetical protein WIW50_06075 [Flavobacteriaceae bacterium 3-367]|uniref:hypothetical protein n=1 Tax=Eudoraea algarum TaxID=3417568 RepID=UPI00326B2595